MKTQVGKLAVKEFRPATQVRFAVRIRADSRNSQQILKFTQKPVGVLTQVAGNGVEHGQSFSSVNREKPGFREQG
jgi:hypothetical protein